MQQSTSPVQQYVMMPQQQAQPIPQQQQQPMMMYMQQPQQLQQHAGMFVQPPPSQLQPSLVVPQQPQMMPGGPVVVPPMQGGQFVLVPGGPPHVVPPGMTALPQMAPPPYLAGGSGQALPPQPMQGGEAPPLSSLFQVVPSAGPLQGQQHSSYGSRGDHGKSNSTSSHMSGSSVSSDTPCRHFIEGKCNRRKCRFRHDSTSTASHSGPLMGNSGLVTNSAGGPSMSSTGSAGSK